MLTGVSKRYAGRAALDGLSLTVRLGGVTALLGPNGAGKTTTVEMCEGYRRPDAGTVRVLGLDPMRDHAALMPRIGVMLQAGGVYPGIRSLEMLHLVASFAADPVDPALLVERLGLESHGRTPYRRLSGGEKQRLALACAVVGRPELVFLDEPTAGLDPQARRAAWDLVAELRTDGVTVLLTTHAMDEAEQLADDVIIIDRGRVVATGSPGDLTRGGEQLRFSAAPGLDLASLRAALPAGVTIVEPTPGCYVVAGEREGGEPAVDPAVLATVTGWCAEHGVLARDLQLGRRTLEDVFFEMTGRALRT